ncbi:hypothetical protein QEH44_gp30 [Arthrobacter phage Shambre1]|uniref:Helix-turn-helix DNA binding domain protein n=1 Tax=Arthrobacter phage Shambre1 TaxID=2927284 RepID=A0A977PT17_9CAUD|nr:hypothetical protein QEH44_gp30 [Arthrobacter phage Shambre1]UXE04766.1 hypothetical protein SEA_SHAMBRE1_30 [Arthrobacter phage Shambre1]
MITYWGFTQIAEHTGVASGTLRQWYNRGSNGFPKPDAKVGDNPGWKPATIDKWNEARRRAAVKEGA